MPPPAHPTRRPAMVTGASSGIGEATARALARAGHPVALGARRVDRCREIAKEIREGGGEAVAHPLDVTDDESVTAFADAVRADLGPVEVLVCNAGVVNPGAIHEVGTQRFAAEIDLNLLGTHRLVTALVPSMVERRRGDVVLVSSDVAVRARAFMGAYAASKWGLEGMAAAMQMELEGTGIRVSLVRPGPTASEMGSSWDAAEGARTLDAWLKFGQARYAEFLHPSALAEAITTVVTAPRGVHLSLVEVNPEAPVETPSKEDA